MHCSIHHTADGKVLVPADLVTSIWVTACPAEKRAAFQQKSYAPEEKDKSELSVSVSRDHDGSRYTQVRNDILVNRKDNGHTYNANKKKPSNNDNDTIGYTAVDTAVECVMHKQKLGARVSCEPKALYLGFKP